MSSVKLHSTSAARHTFTLRREEPLHLGQGGLGPRQVPRVERVDADPCLLLTG
jgi:hypothetical protein